MQIHHLPFSLLTDEVAFKLGDTLGNVIRTGDSSDMRGRTFMRVRVSLNILEPICCGRCVTFGQNSEGWIYFSYERLPNICYWCGRFTHDDKECLVWLQSKGSIVVEDQQFGAWLRAPQFNLTRRSYVEVKGFEKEENSSRVVVGKSDSVVVVPATSTAACLVDNVLNKETPDTLEFNGCTKSSADFAVTLQDIDDELQRFSNSNLSTAIIIKGSDKSVAEIKGVDRASEISDQAITDLVNDDDMLLDGKVMTLNYVELKELNFELGWVGKTNTKKGGPSKIRRKEKNKLTGPGFIHATLGLNQDFLMHNGPKQALEVDILMQNGLKRKGEVLDVDNMECGEKEKRVK